MSTPGGHASGGSSKYTTNLNRTVTKKWQAAAAVSYDGDDWGPTEDEEEDDDVVEPLVPSKPTGLRQKGQVIQPVSSNDMNKKSYGNLPALETPNQPRSLSSTASSHLRQNSFEHGDEKRAFSSNTPTTDSRAGIPSLHVSTQQPPVTGLRKASQPELPPVDASVRKSLAQQSDGIPDSLSEFTPQTTSTNYSDDIQNRRDYSPSAVPAPLSAVSMTRNSADPHNSHFPPRHSSLSQPPDLSGPLLRDAAARPWSETSQSSSRSVAAKQDASVVKPLNDARVGPPGMQSTRSPTSPSAQKPLPFVRPADIYKRLAEEKERERQSLDSSRPSMESLDAGTVPNRNPSAAYHEDASSESYAQGGAESDTPSLHSAKGLMQILEPVQERKSEYGFDGFKPPVSHSRDASDVTITSTNQGLDENRYSRSPELPNLNRVSGFGEDFFSSKDPAGSHHAEETTEEPHDAFGGQPTLRTEPSLGFRSAVNTAFENANSVPPTPSSRLGDSIGRSDSESTGTTGISPIMSRAPSGRNQLEGSTPAIEEVTEPDSRPPSAETTSVATSNKGAGVPLEEDNSLTPPARPRAERDQSFRPNLPGGWNSYATNMSDRTVRSVSITRKSLPGSEVSSMHENGEGGSVDTTPTVPQTATLPAHGAKGSYFSNILASTVGQQRSPTAIEDSSNQVEAISRPQSFTSPIGGFADNDSPPLSPLKAKTNTTLSIDSAPDDIESDKLRKEIVKSLNPGASAEYDSIPLDLEKELPDTSQNARESYYRSSIYEHYMDEPEDEAPAEQGPVASSLQESQKSLVEMPIIQPLASRKVSKSSQYRPTAERRFSWEAAEEQLNANSVPPSDVEVYSPVVQPTIPTATSAVPKDENDQGLNTTNPAAASSDSQLIPQSGSNTDPISASVNEAYNGEVALATGGLASAATYASKDATMDKSDTPLSAHDDNTTQLPPSSPVSSIEQSIRRGSSVDPNEGKPTHTQRLSLSQGSGTGNWTSNSTLKDILKLPNPSDRIRAYGEVQNQLATADTGLGEWLATMKSENPEYADIEGNFGGPNPYVSTSAKSKFAKVLSPNSTNLQQPYYQQYLNASSPTSPQPMSPRPPGSGGGYVHSSGQGGLSAFSGGGSKITTQQVQAKSKELLHTAGIFGGKGMKAGKGLLAKGKSRFGSRGTDKISSDNSKSLAITNATEQRPRASFGHRRLNTIDAPKGLGRRSEDSASVDDKFLSKEWRRSTFGFGGRGGSVGGAKGVGRFSRLGMGIGTGKMAAGGERGQDSSEANRVEFTRDLRGVHEMHLKKSDESAPTLPAIKINSSLESPTRAMSMDSSAWAAREEYHRHKRSESGLSHHSRSGSAMSGSRRDMSFFLADDDVSEESREGSVSYGESDENISYGVAKPAPISKLQPTWDPYLASPILEGEEDSPLSKQGTSIMRLVPKSMVPSSIPVGGTETDALERVLVEFRNEASQRVPVASLSKTPTESPIIGHPDPNDEPDDWVIVDDTQPKGKEAVHYPAAAALESPDTPMSAPKKHPDEGSATQKAPAQALEPVSIMSNDFDVCEDTRQHVMTSTQREITPSEISIDSGIEYQDEEFPDIPKPFHPFVSSGGMTPDEIESPIIPNIFRTIKGDPPTQYARASGSMKPEGQESPKFSLPLIRRGSTFSSLISGWPSALSRPGSRSSKASRFHGDDGNDEAEEIPPMPPTPGFARPGTSDSEKRAQEKMKAVSVAESDDISQPEDLATIGALVAAGLVAAAFGDETPNPMRQRHSATFEQLEGAEKKSTVDREKQGAESNCEKPDLFSESPRSVDSPDTEVPNPIMPSLMNGSRESHITVMPPVVVHEQAPEVPDRPSTPIDNLAKSAHPALLLATPEAQPHSPDQSTPATLVDESRAAPDRLSKSSEQWVENAPMADSYIPPSHPPPNHPPPSLPATRPNISPVSSEDSVTRGERRSHRPEIRIETIPKSSPSSSTQANYNSSPLQHRSLPSYESPRISVPPPVMRQSYGGFASTQAQMPSSSKMNEELAPRDLPQHLYQAPISKRESFLPRQQTSEYEIPGLGPPSDEPATSTTRSSRRSSAAFFKEIGGRLSRTGSLGPDEQLASPVYRHHGPAAASVSSVTSEDIREKIRNQSRRSSLFGLGTGSLSRSSTGKANSSNGPRTPGGGSFGGVENNNEWNPVGLTHRESMITHRPGSRRDTLESWSEGPRTPSSPLPRVDEDDRDKKGARAFFANVGGRTAAKGFVPALSVPVETAPMDKGKAVKKSRFRLSGFLGRTGKQKESVSEEYAPPPTANSLSSIQQTPIEYRPRNKSLGQLPILARPLGRGNKNPRTDENQARTTSEERERQRKEAAHALLTGPSPPAYTPPLNDFIDQREEVDRDPEKEDLSMHIHPVHRPPPKQTPIFIEEFPDRGRRKTKEPQYDTPPIPGAYNLVRGEGNSSSSTPYDAHDYNRQPQVFETPLQARNGASPQGSQSPPSHIYHPTQTQHLQGSPSSSNLHPSAYTTPREEQQGFHRPSDVSAEESDPNTMGLGFREDGRIAWQQSKTRRNVSREDLLARSPARPIFGQQRPYQLCLPEEEEFSPKNTRNGFGERSGSASTESREVGLGLGVEGQGGGQSHGRNVSAGTVMGQGSGSGGGGGQHHLGLHPSLKKREGSEQTWQPLPATGIFETPPPPLHGKPSNTPLLPSHRRDLQEIERSNSAVSQLSRKIVISPAQVAYDREIYDSSPISRGNRNMGMEREQEEKIVDVENRGRSEVVELPAGGMGVDDDDRGPVMSATSYPGMEWNPYAYGEMEYD